MLAVALIPSNQDTWHPPHDWPRQFWSYSEAGGAAQLVARVEPLLRQAGAIVRAFAAPLESADDGRHTALRATMREARLWLDSAPELAHKAAVHVHTNAGSTPLAGNSHTGYCWFAGCPGGRELGQAIAERTGAALGLPVVAYDYSGLDYLADLVFRPLPSVIVEATRHDRLADLTALYARVDAVAAAIAGGVLAWAGEPAPPDETARLRARVAELEDRIARARAALD